MMPGGKFYHCTYFFHEHSFHRQMQLVSWLVIVILPLCLVLGSKYLGSSIALTLLGYLLFLLFVRLFGKKIFKSIFDRVQKQKSE